MDRLRIVPLTPAHVAAYDALNRAWLVEHALIEPDDEAQLADPWTHIVAPGGQVFVALEDDDPVGTCGIIPLPDGRWELAKLAVAPRAQGRGLGQRLVLACLAWAKERGARRIVLLSSSRLPAAIRLYERLGFRHRPVPADAHYATADVYMELAVNEEDG